MDIETFRDHLYRVVQVEQPGTAPSYLKQDAVTALNRAYQNIWNAPNADFLTREIHQFATASGISEYQLDDDVQEVLGPLRFSSSGKPIAPCDSKGEFLSFGAIYSGNDYDTDNADPQVFWVDRRRKTGDAQDEVVEIYLMLAPTPASTKNLEVDLARECPVFTVDSFCDGSKLPTPHRYHESILLPLAQYHMTQSHLFRRGQEALRGYQESYAAALTSLGVSDPQIYSVDKKSRTGAMVPKS